MRSPSRILQTTKALALDVSSCEKRRSLLLPNPRVQLPLDEQMGALPLYDSKVPQLLPEGIP